MTAKTETPKEPDRAPTPAELARRYLDLWEANLCLCAREGEAPQPGAGSARAEPG